MTEAPMLTFARLDDDDDVRAFTNGRAARGAEIRMVGSGGAAARGEVGGVEVRGAGLMLGYVDRALDDEAFTPDGWLRTGDLGSLDANGNLTITGRIKETIIRNMENISSLEVETSLIAHPAIDELVTWARGEGVMVQKIPERLEYIDELPRNALGKVAKPELKARYATAQSGSRS